MLRKIKNIPSGTMALIAFSAIILASLNPLCIGLGALALLYAIGNGYHNGKPSDTQETRKDMTRNIDDGVTRIRRGLELARDDQERSMLRLWVDAQLDTEE